MASAEAVLEAADSVGVEILAAVVSVEAAVVLEGIASEGEAAALEEEVSVVAGEVLAVIASAVVEEVVSAGEDWEGAASGETVSAAAKVAEDWEAELLAAEDLVEEVLEGTDSGPARERVDSVADLEPIDSERRPADQRARIPERIVSREATEITADRGAIVAARWAPRGTGRGVPTITLGATRVVARSRSTAVAARL